MSKHSIDHQVKGLARRHHRYPSIGVLERLIERAGGAARVESVFGEPIRTADAAVVPVARVRFLSSLGSGTNRLRSSMGDGGGGAAAARADPVGYLLVRADEAVFRPIRRPAAVIVLPLAAITAVAALGIVGMSLRAARHSRKMDLKKAALNGVVVTPPAEPEADTD